MAHKCKIHGSHCCKCSSSCSHGSHKHCESCGQEICEICEHEHHNEQHDHEDYARRLLQMADDAWEELLVDKIKEHIGAESEKNLDKLAKIVAESNHERWKHKIDVQRVGEEYMAKLFNFFQKK